MNTAKNWSEVKEAVRTGKTVYYGKLNSGYVVIETGGRFDVTFLGNGYTTGLFWLDGVTTDYKPEQFVWEM